MCDAIRIGNTYQALKKILYSRFYYLLRLLKNEQKTYLFAAHLEQHFKATKSRTDIRKYMAFKAVK